MESFSSLYISVALGGVMWMYHVALGIMRHEHLRLIANVDRSIVTFVNSLSGIDAGLGPAAYCSSNTFSPTFGAQSQALLRHISSFGGGRSLSPANSPYCIHHVSGSMASMMRIGLPHREHMLRSIGLPLLVSGSM